MYACGNGEKDDSAGASGRGGKSDQGGDSSGVLTEVHYIERFQRCCKMQQHARHFTIVKKQS